MPLWFKSIFVPVRPKSWFVHPRGIRNTDWKKINESPLKKAGLLARKIERGLIRKDTTKKQTPSKPGKPPKSRFPGHPFRAIFSLPDVLGTSVLVGHEGFGQRHQTPMELHEFGQTARVRVIPVRQRKITDPKRRRQVALLFRLGIIKRRPLPKQTRTVKFPERPFAKPTTERVAARMPQLWKNSIGNIQVRN